MQAQAKLVANQHNHRLAEKQRTALANRIKYLNAQNSRVLRDLQAVHRTAQKLDQGRVRQMERQLHEREVKDEKEGALRDKAMKVAGIRQEKKEISWKVKGVRENRLNAIKNHKEDRCKNLMKSTDVVENNIASLEEEEKMCVERLTYSKMMSQRVLYQLERNIGSRQSASLNQLEEGRQVRAEKPTEMPEMVQVSPRQPFQPASRTATPQYVAHAGPESSRMQSARVLQRGEHNVYTRSDQPQQAPMTFSPQGNHFGGGAPGPGLVRSHAQPMAARQISAVSGASARFQPM